MLTVAENSLYWNGYNQIFSILVLCSEGLTILTNNAVNVLGLGQSDSYYFPLTTWFQSQCRVFPSNLYCFPLPLVLFFIECLCICSGGVIAWVNVKGFVAFKVISARCSSSERQGSGETRCLLNSLLPTPGACVCFHLPFPSWFFFFFSFKVLLP